LRAVGSAWIFGYGSLVFRAGFVHRRRAPGWLHGFRRRLWQGSPDHRGTPEAPGRVATLVPDPGARVLGVAFEVDRSDLDDVLRTLDLREQAGYERLERPVLLLQGGVVEGVVYAAGPTNPSWLGPADPLAIARHVDRASGPSGRNRDYVLRVAEVLRDLGVEDDEILTVAAELEKLR
jgi:cation transport regulator ChaC